MPPQNRNDEIESAMRRLDALQSSLNGILAENVRTNTILTEVVKPKLELVDKHDRIINRAWGWVACIAAGSGAIGAKAAKAFGILGEANR